MQTIRDLSVRLEQLWAEYDEADGRALEAEGASMVECLESNRDVIAAEINIVEKRLASTAIQDDAEMDVVIRLAGWWAEGIHSGELVPRWVEEVSPFMCLALLRLAEYAGSRDQKGRRLANQYGVDSERWLQGLSVPEGVAA